MLTRGPEPYEDYNAGIAAGPREVIFNKIDDLEDILNPARAPVPAKNRERYENNVDRFDRGVAWRDPRSGDAGVGRASNLTNGSGYFWFFHPDNLEIAVKVLDACAVNGHRWVFSVR